VNEPAVPSEAARVTFYEDRAEVVRRARVAVDAGASWVKVAGVGVALDDRSLQAQARGARVVAARVHRQARQVPAAGAAEIEAAEADLRAARGRRAAEEAGVARALADERRAAGLLESWATGVSRAPRGGEDEAARWKLVHESLTGALATALDETAARRAALERAQLDEERAALRAAQARALEPRFEAAALVQLEAERAGVVELELTYRTPLALWRPEHVARLEARPRGHELTVRTVATVWQRTGEDWRDVACRFSTARPARAAAPPLLADDLVRMARKADRAVVVEGRDVAVATVAPENGARKVEEMPGVEDGGEPLWFEAARPVTIPSDGQPFRVELAEVRLPCEVQLVAYPELGGAAHLRATATLAGGRPLLAGPVRVARGASIVGRGRLGFVGAGEPFELGFGVDDGVRVRRRVDERRDTAAVTGTQRIARSVRLFLSNLGDRPRRLRVVERVPVSELEDVSVKVVAAEGGTVDERDGFVRFDVELAGGATRELELAYRIDAAARVQLGS
jgi:uncharacterized protein (TIGR02231 family)